MMTLYTLGNFTLEELEEKDLGLVRGWRNSAEVRRWMFNGDYITEEEHKRWFASRKDRANLLFSFDGKRIGLIQLSNKNSLSRHCELGFYIGEKEYQKSGMGAVMEYMALEVAFEVWGLNRVWCSTLAYNKPVISLHQRFGFSDEGILRGHVKKKDGYVDAVMQGIVKDEWLAKKDAVYDTIRKIYGL